MCMKHMDHLVTTKGRSTAADGLASLPADSAGLQVPVMGGLTNFSSGEISAMEISVVIESYSVQVRGNHTFLSS